MAYKNPPVHTRFKPGNPGPGPIKDKLPLHLQAIRDLSGTEVKKTIAYLVRLTEAQLAERLDNKAASIFEKILAAGLQKALKEGDYSRVNFLLDRTIGRVKESMEIIQPEPVVIHRINGETVELGTKSETIIDAEQIKDDSLETPQEPPAESLPSDAAIQN